METQKIINLLDNTGNECSTFAIKNGILLTMNLKVTVHTKSAKIFNKFIRIKSL